MNSGAPDPQLALQQAIAAYQRGDWAASEASCRQVLAARAGDFDALNLLGIIAAQTQRLPEAAELLRRAVAAKPSDASAHNNLANVLKSLARLDEALAAYDRALAIQPRYAEAHYNRGDALAALGRREEAIAAYDRAVALKPDYAKAWYNRGIALEGLGRREAAVASYDRAVALKPDFAEAHYNRGVVLAALGELDAAVASYERAIALKPEFVQPLNNLGNALLRLCRPADAVAAYDRALALRPDYVEALVNRGRALLELRQVEDAIAAFDRAIALDPGYGDAWWNKSLALLLGGDFAGGWELYEWRWKLDAFASLRREHPQPRWDGAAPLAGRTILLHGEQGLGDVIQFCRYAPMVAGLGAKVVLEVQRPLVPLMKSLAGVETVVVAGEAIPPVELRCPLLSLPRAFRTDLATIPAPRRYLSADPGRIREWQERLGPRRGLRVGVAWSSTSAFPRDYVRSLRFADFARALPVSGVEFVCLQKEFKPADRRDLEARPDLRSFGDELRDFGDTAALVECVDLVVSTCTSIPHLAGALGKPTWILLANVPDWRWLLDGESSPWYPAAKLYRQERPGDWTGVLARVRADLERLRSEEGAVRGR